MIVDSLNAPQKARNNAGRLETNIASPLTDKILLSTNNTSLLRKVDEQKWSFKVVNKH